MLDVDGVLINGRPQDGQRWDFALQQDLGIDPALLGQEFFARDWADIIVGKTALRSALASCLQRLQTTVTAEELMTYWFEHDSRIMEPVLSDCRAARNRGIAVYLATNQEHERARYLMDTMGLKTEVDGIIYSAQAGCRKPHADFYAHAVQATGFQPKELLLVDDTVANIEGARKAGWTAVHWDASETLAGILQRTE